MFDAPDLIPRLKSFDGEAWHTLDRSIRRDLVHFFLRRLSGSDLELATELAQDTLVRALTGIRKFDEARGTSLRSWIFGIARHLYLNTLRRWHQHPEVELEEALSGAIDPHDPSTWIGLREDLKWALGRLSQWQRVAFLAFEESGYTLAEIAADRGCSVGAVKAVLYQARKNLKCLLRERDPDLLRPHTPGSIHHPIPESNQ